MQAAEWVVRSFTIVLDNDAHMQPMLAEIAANAVRDDMGTGMGRDEYEMMLNGKGQTDRREYAEVVGIAITDALVTWLDDLRDRDVYFNVLSELLDATDSEQQRLFGYHYLPDSADDIEWED